jgi:hypothetical protein
MPSRVDPRQRPLAEDDDAKLAELDALVLAVTTENENLRAELERATAECESLRYEMRRQEIERAEDEEQLDGDAPRREHPELLLIMLIFVIAVRVFLFIGIEECGKTASIEGILANVALIISAIWLLGSWARLEWKAHRWVIVPRAGFLIIGGITSLSIIAGEDVWEATYTPPDAISAILAAAFMGVALVIAASDIPSLLVKSTLNLIAWLGRINDA